MMKSKCLQNHNNKALQMGYHLLSPLSKLNKKPPREKRQYQKLDTRKQLNWKTTRKAK